MVHHRRSLLTFGVVIVMGIIGAAAGAIAATYYFGVLG